MLDTSHDVRRTLIGGSSMDILPSCVLCGNPFTPKDIRQKRCPDCVLKRKSCAVCGIEKRSPGLRCVQCEYAARFGRPNLKIRREEKPIEQVISEAEVIGLLPEKRYAFGYVIGVIFGDGSISKDVVKHLKRADGSPRVRPVTLYRVRLQVTEEAFAERFVKQWSVLTGKTPNIWQTTRTNFNKSTLKGRREEYSVQLFDVNFAHALFGRYLAHLKYGKHSSRALDFPIETTRGFVHGMIDSEGYLNAKKPGRIDIANKDIGLLDTLVKMFASLGFKATIYTYPSQNVSHLVTHMPYVKYAL